MGKDHKDRRVQLLALHRTPQRCQFESMTIKDSLNLPGVLVTGGFGIVGAESSP